MLENINRETLTQYIDHTVDRRFEELRSRRTKIESDWVEMIKSATFGTAPDAVKSSIVKLYTNLSDMTLPSLCRRLHARETSWLDRDFFRWVPDGVESVDTDGAYWLTDWQKDNLNNELSQFHAVMRAALWQRQILNISAINFNWVIKPKIEYKYSSTTLPTGEIETGSVEIEQKPFEFDLQGVKYEFVSMFSLYPDNIQVPTFENLNILDLYYQNFYSLNEIKNNTLYNSDGHYTYKVNVLYRSTEGLEELINTSPNFSAAQIRLNQDLTNSKNESERKKNVIEVRTALLKEIKLPDMQYCDNAGGRGYRLVYAKANGQFIPLFLEALPNLFEQKTLRLSRRYADPYNLYNKSEVGLAINQHFYIVNQKKLQATALAKAVNPNYLWSTALPDSFEGSTDELKSMWLSTGANKFVNHEKLSEAMQKGGLDPTKPLTLGSSEEYIRNIELLETGISKAKNDLQEINAQLNTETGASATAEYNRQMAQQVDMLSSENKRAICDDWLRPSLEYGFELAKRFFQDQKFSTDITEEEKDYFVEQAGGEIEWNDIKNNPNPDGQLLQKPARIAGQETPVIYNPVVEKKQMILSKTLFENTTASLDLEFEDTEYSKPIELQEKVQLYGQLMANLPDGQLKYLIAKIALEQSLQLTNDPSYAEIKKQSDQLYEQMTAPQPPPEPDPLQQQAMQLNM